MTRDSLTCLHLQLLPAASNVNAVQDIFGRFNEDNGPHFPMLHKVTIRFSPYNTCTYETLIKDVQSVLKACPQQNRRPQPPYEAIPLEISMILSMVDGLLNVDTQNISRDLASLKAPTRPDHTFGISEKE